MWLDVSQWLQVTIRMGGSDAHALEIDQYVLRRSSGIYRRKMEFQRALDVDSSSQSCIPLDDTEWFLHVPECVTSDYRLLASLSPCW